MRGAGTETQVAQSGPHDGRVSGSGTRLPGRTGERQNVWQRKWVTASLAPKSQGNLNRRHGRRAMRAVCKYLEGYENEKPEKAYLKLWGRIWKQREMAKVTRKNLVSQHAEELSRTWS